MSLSASAAQDIPKVSRAELQKMEKELDASRGELTRNGWNGLDFQQALHRAALLPQGPERNALLDQIRKGDQALNSFQSLFDRYQLGRMDFYVGGIFDEMRDHMSRIRGLRDTKLQSRLQAQFDRIQGTFQTYQETRTLYGQPKDFQRITNFKNFFVSVKAYLDLVQEELRMPSAKANAKADQRFLERLRDLLNAVVRTVTGICRLLPNGSTLAKYVLFNGSTPTPTTPFVEAYTDAFRNLSEMQGFKFDVEGLQNVPKTRDDRTIRLLLPTHTSNELDQASLGVLAKRGIFKDFSIFLGMDPFWPKFLKPVLDKIDAGDQIIMVGRGSGQPIQKMLDLIEKKKIRTFVNFPEGAVSTGMHEIKPLQEKFASGLLEALREKGYKVELIPITFTRSFRFNPDAFQPEERLGGTPRDAGKTVKIVVNPAIRDEDLTALDEATGDLQARNRMIREVWMDGFPEDAHKIVGSPRIDEMDSLVNRYLAGKYVPSPGSGTNDCLMQWLRRVLTSPRTGNS